MLRVVCALAFVSLPLAAQVSACAPCHAKIAATYLKTGMGRSFARMPVRTFPAKPYYHQPSDSYFAMEVRNGRVYQRRWQIAPGGAQVNVDEKQVDYVMGSGNHAETFLHLTARGTLQQLPLGWYAENGGMWAMNPGYDKPDYPGSTREIHYECMGCHNAYPRIPQANEEEGAEPVYSGPLPEGIDCQRCHGDGRQHIATSGASPMVNPAKLPPDREFEVCLQCHLETSSRLLPHSIQKHGRKPFSYRPGEPLADFELTFDRAPGQNQAVEVAGGAYRLRQSRCYLASAGKLRCTTCHDPHDIAHGEPAMAAYNKVCATCHRSAHRAAENCVGCHMPKTRTDDAVHIVITDHRIQRPPASANLLAAKAESHDTPATAYRGPVVAYYPAAVDPLYQAVAQVRDASNLKPGLATLKALVAQTHPAQAGFYADLGDAYRTAGDLPNAVAAFQDALARSPDSAAIVLQLANALVESHQWAKAETILRQATARHPSDAVEWGQFGWVLWQEDKAAEARADLAKSMALDPELPEMRNYLGKILLGTGDRAGAERQYREGVRLAPGIAEWRTNLGGLLASTGSLPEARYQYDQAIRFKPGDATVQLNYARFLASTGDEQAAAEHARTSISLDPSLAGGHEIWGALLLNGGDVEGALRELQEAVRLDPSFARAQFELGVVLYARGDVAGAVEHLKQASREGSRDADQYLQRIGK
ncbi:MAG TPA: tetratricopeptide repeat protein [Bryobacteraceae bacterium]|jgi:tetratricopeptide (TPR) repeat protein|nr:tetratricopeptide repeat protein [Bryobacteraceae bacterium]